jgi:hypothetical protein
VKTRLLVGSGGQRPAVAQITQKDEAETHDDGGYRERESPAGPRFEQRETHRDDEQGRNPLLSAGGKAEQQGCQQRPRPAPRPPLQRLQEGEHGGEQEDDGPLRCAVITKEGVVVEAELQECAKRHHYRGGQAGQTSEAAYQRPQERPTRHCDRDEVQVVLSGVPVKDVEDRIGEDSRDDLGPSELDRLTHRLPDLVPQREVLEREHAAEVKRPFVVSSERIRASRKQH